MIYIGTNKNNKDYYLSYDDCKAIYVVGITGSGKTTYIETVMDRLKQHDLMKNLNLAIYTSKGFDYICNYPESTYTSIAKFLNKMKALLDSKNKSLIIIDDLMSAFNDLDENDAFDLLLMIKKVTCQNNATIICTTQIYKESIADVFDTKIFMRNGLSLYDLGKEYKESNLIGELFVLNKNVKEYSNLVPLKAVKSK